jgi:23S rRNA (cytosine1962-C5)-methyltransferase
MSESGTAAQLPVLRLKRNEDRRLHAGHLWVFSNEVDTQQTPLPKFKAGELVRVLAHNDRALGLAYVNPKSLISARMLQTWTMPDAAWFAARIRVALALRERLYADPYYRVVYGESDGLPGLVVDRYGSQCVVQIGTAGMELLKPHIQEAVLRVLKCDALLFKNDSGAREMEGLPSYVEAVKGTFDELGLVLRSGGESTCIAQVRAQRCARLGRLQLLRRLGRARREVGGGGGHQRGQFGVGAGAGCKERRTQRRHRVDAQG